jgi:hypothetical protein
MNKIKLNLGHLFWDGKSITLSCLIHQFLVASSLSSCEIEYLVSS